MGFISNIVKVGLVGGAVYAVAKIAEKYSDNNPYGVSGKEEKKEAIKQAATETFEEAKKVYEEKSPAVKAAVSAVAQKVVDEAWNVAPDAAEKVQDAVHFVSEKVRDVADTIIGDGISVEFSVVRDQEDKPEVNDGPASVTPEDFATEQPAEEPTEKEAEPAQEPERLEPIVPNKD